MLEKKDLSRRTFLAGSAVAAGAATLATTGCSNGGDKGGSAPVEDGKATLVFKNARVQTMVAEDDVAEAVAVKGNEIVYVGDNAGVEEFVGDGTEVIDLGVPSWPPASSTATSTPPATGRTSCSRSASRA